MQWSACWSYQISRHSRCWGQIGLATLTASHHSKGRRLNGKLFEGRMTEGIAGFFGSPLVLAGDLQPHSTHYSLLVPPSSRISFRKLLGMAKGKSAGVSCMWTSYTRKVQKGQMGNSVGLQAQNQTLFILDYDPHYVWLYNIIYIYIFVCVLYL